MHKIVNMEKLTTPKTVQKIHGDTLIGFFKDYISYFLEQKESLLFIEIGSERGAGSTYLLAKQCKKWNMPFITIDAAEIRTKDASIIVKNINPEFKAINDLGEIFLQQYDKKNIGVCYLDAFDLVVDDHNLDTEFVKTYSERNVDINNEAAYKMHYDACVSLIEKTVPGGFICFDDVWLNDQNIWEGKGKTAIPLILENGFELVGYRKTSALFQKTIGMNESKKRMIKSLLSQIHLDEKITYRRLKRLPINLKNVLFKKK